MKGSEILIRLHVDPVSDLWLLLSRSRILVCNSCSPYVLKNDLKRVGIIEICAVCQETEVEWVLHYGQVQYLVWHLQMLDQAFVILVVDELEDSLSSKIANLSTWQDFVISSWIRVRDHLVHVVSKYLIVEVTFIRWHVAFNWLSIHILVWLVIILGILKVAASSIRGSRFALSNFILIVLHYFILYGSDVL